MVHLATDQKCTTYSIVDPKSAPHTLPRGDRENRGKNIGLLLKPPLSLPLCDEFIEHKRRGRLLPFEFYDEHYKESNRLKLPRHCLHAISKQSLKHCFKEKLLWLCHELHATGASTPDGAPVNNHFYRSRIGMRGADLIQQLLRFKCIEKCKNHSSGRAAARYRFSSIVLTDLRIAHYKLKTEKLIKKRASKKCKTMAMLSATNYPKKFLSDLDKIKASAQFIEQFEDYLVESAALGKRITSTQALLNFWKNGRARMSIKDFRITTHICGTPSSLRELLLINGESSHEVDLPNSHPALLAAIFRPTDDSLQAEHDQHARLVRLIQSGLFYESFEHCWKNDRWEFVKMATKVKGRAAEDIIKDKADFLRRSPRKGIKLCWQLIINCQSTFYGTQLMDELSKSLPYFTKRMNALKKSGKDTLGKTLRRREAQMVAAIASRVMEPCATIYDGWLSTEAGINQVVEAAHIETAKPEHLGFVHLPLRKGEPKPEHTDAQKWRTEGQQAALNGGSYPF